MSSPRVSTAAFWLAFAVLVIGLFVALGGPAYAGELPSAAEHQYGEQIEDATTETTPVFLPPQQEDETSRPTGTALPQTGLSLLATVVIGLGLVSLGVALRRREQRKG